jgi:hypothetical protein
MRGKKGKGQLAFGGGMEGELEVVVGAVEGWVSSGNKDIWSQKVEYLLSFVVWVVVGVLPLLGFFPRLGLFSELGG